MQRLARSLAAGLILGLSGSVGAYDTRSAPSTRTSRPLPSKPPLVLGTRAASLRKQTQGRVQHQDELHMPNSMRHWLGVPKEATSHDTFSTSWSKPVAVSQAGQPQSSGNPYLDDLSGNTQIMASEKKAPHHAPVASAVAAPHHRKLAAVSTAASIAAMDDLPNDMPGFSSLARTQAPPGTNRYLNSVGWVETTKDSATNADNSYMEKLKGKSRTSLAALLPSNNAALAKDDQGNKYLDSIMPTGPFGLDTA